MEDRKKKPETRQQTVEQKTKIDRQKALDTRAEDRTWKTEDTRYQTVEQKTENTRQHIEQKTT